MPNADGGSCTISVNDQHQITCNPDPVTPNDSNDITFTLNSTGNKLWNFNPNNPINIANPHDFTATLVTPTQLLVTDTSADERTIPQHNYTVVIQSQNGDDQFEYDPVIKDHT